jgi:hypothetical protein
LFLLQVHTDRNLVTDITLPRSPKDQNLAKKEKEKEKRLGMFGKTRKLNLVPLSNAFGIKNIKFDLFFLILIY